MFDSFLKCPANFYKQYILGERDTVKSSALEFGSAIHSAIEDILEVGGGIETFTQKWDLLRDENMIYYRHGWQELRDLAVNRFLPNFERLHSKKFHDYNLERTLQMPFLGEHTLQGTPDMIGQYEGQLTVTDYKTSSTEYKRHKIDKNPQMYIYAALCRNEGIIPTQIMYKVFRKDNGSIQTLKKELHIEDLDAKMKNVENIAKAILHMIETKEIYHTFEDCWCKGV